MLAGHYLFLHLFLFSSLSSVEWSGVIVVRQIIQGTTHTERLSLNANPGWLMFVITGKHKPSMWSHLFKKVWLRNITNSYNRCIKHVIFTVNGRRCCVRSLLQARTIYLTIFYWTAAEEASDWRNLVVSTVVFSTKGCVCRVLHFVQ